MTRLEELKAKMTQNNNVNANTSSGNTPTRLAQLKAKTLQNTNATNTNINTNTIPTESLNKFKNIAQTGIDMQPTVKKPTVADVIKDGANMRLDVSTTTPSGNLSISNINKSLIQPQQTFAGDKSEINDGKSSSGLDVIKGSIASLGANALDATVDTGQFVKNAFKSEMKRDEREAIESLIKLENGYRGIKNQLSEQQARTMSDNIRKNYGLEGLTVQELQNKLNGIIDWTYKENALERVTSNLANNVNQNNSELGTGGQFITNAFGTVGRMGPTIASNLVLPGSGMPVMFANVAQSQTENLMEQGVNYKDAVTNGLLSGALEVGTEALSSGISQKLTGIPAISKVGNYTKNIANPFIRGAINVGLDVASEGLEEVASTAIQPFIDRITYDKNAPLATGEDLLASFTESVLPTLLMQGGSFAIQKLNQYTETQKNEIEKADISSNAKKQMIEALEMQKDKIAKQIEELSKSNTNLQENAQNHSNIEQSSQNVSNLENNQQMSISDVENTNATLPSHIQTFVENRNKVSPGLSVQIDNTLNTDGVIIKNQDGTRTIKVNPNSNNAYEFVTMHEMLHDLSGTQEYQELANFVKERAMTHDTFEEAKQTITDKYTKYYQENGLDMSNLNMDVETVNDMTAQALGNQEFLNELAGKKPNVFMRIYNWVKNVLFDGQKTGKTFSERRADNKYLNELKKKFETAYNTAYKGIGETKYSIQTDNNGNKYVKVDTDQNIFEGKTLKEQKEIAKEYILKNFREKGLIKDNQNINVTRKTANEYTYPKNILNKGIASDKMKASTELNNLLNISQYKYSKPDDGRHSFAQNGWEYYETIFQVGNKTYSGLLNIANDGNKKMLYDITNIKEMNSNISMKTESSANSSLSNYTIPSTDGTVNNQYMQNNENDVQEYYSISGNGYSGHSMSNNAIKAYEEGKKPISKFVKEDVNKFNQLLQQRGINEKITLKELKALLEKYSGSEWHHTSSRYNKTNFYDINDVLENDNSDIENTIKKIRDSKEKSANIKEILKTKSGETEQEYYTRIGNYVLDKRIERYNKDGLNFLAVKEEESRKDPSYVYNAGRTFGVWDYGAKYTPQELENSSSFSLPKNNSKIDEIADILNIYEQYKYEDKTPITESIDELEQKISETTDWDTRYDLNAKLKALKNEYNSVYDYLIGREKQRIAENLNYNEHYYDKQLNEKTQKIERQKKLEKEIKEATPFKRAQYEIIQETNPMFDDEHVGIRSPADIKTFEEVIDDEESFQWGDYTKEDALKDLKRNKVRVYSSYPIKNGVFVSTSYEQALEYAENDRSKVHSKEVAPNRVAWINGDEGQYASVTNERLNKAKSLDNTTSTTNSDIRYSQSDKSWSKYLKEYWDLMPNSTKTFGLPSAEELQRFDYEKLHMINENDNELNAMRLKKTPTYKTNLERGLIEQKIKDIEIGKTNRDDIFETTSKREIRKTIENQLGKKMLTKRFNTNKAYGIYKPMTDTIRLAQESDIETALHELGHQVDIKQLNNMTKQISNTDIRNELIKLCDNAFPNVFKDQRTKIRKGFAEATQNYIIEPQEFAQKYPHTSYLITEQLEKNPSLNSLFTTLQEKVHDYINMSPKDRVLSNVSINDENNKPKIDMKKFGQTFAKLFLDDNIALRNAVKKVAKSQGKKISELSPNENALLLMKLQQGSQDATLMSLSEGYRNKNGEKVTKGLKEVVENFTNEDIQNLIAYMVSEGNLDYINADKQTGIRENDAKAVLKEFKNTKIDKASKEIREINNYALTRLKDAGMLTEEQIKNMKKINEHYVPMNRVIDEDGSIKTGENNMRVGNALKRRKGSDKTIINPLESTIVNNMRIDKQIEANEALKTLVNSLKKAGIAGEYFDTVPEPKIFNGTATLERFKNVLEEQGVDTTDMDLSAVYNIYSPKLSDDKNMIMSYMENGKRKYIQFTDKELYKAINNLNSKQMSLFEQVLSKFNGVLRWGATSANIDFAIPNFIADSQMAFLNSDATYIPIIDSLVGVVDTLAGRGKAEKLLNIIAPDYVEKKKELYYKYKTSGASSDVNRTGLSRGETRNLMEDVYGLSHRALFGKNKSAIQKGKEIFNLTTAPSDLSEEATRFRNFEKEYALYRKQGMSEDEALEKAGYNARRVTQDFSEAGQITRSINRLKPFTSARIGGVTQTFQNMTQNPKRFTKRLAILVAMDVAMYAINRIISKKLGKNKGKELEELQDQKMFDNYTFYIGDNNILTIKKTQGPVRIILNLSEMATDFALGNLDSDGVKKRLRGIFDDAKNDLLFVSDESDLVGQLATPLVENALNKDFYYGNDLINDSMKYLDNKDKYDENTSETAKILGKLLNYPPIYIDNLIEGYLAGVGKQALKVSDSIINKIEGNKVVETPISEKFILGRFFADTNKNSQSVNEIYEEFEKLSNDKEYNRLTPEREEMYDNVSDAKDYISMINKEIRNTKSNENLTGEEKREEIDKLMQLRTDTARYYLGKDIIDESNKEPIETFEYYPSSQTKISSLLDWEEKGEYAQIVKDAYSSNLKELKETTKYIKSNEDEKKSQEKSTLNKAKEKAKQTIVNDNIDDYLEDYGEEELAKIILDADILKKYEKADDKGIPLIDFYNAWCAKKEEEKKKAQKTAINEAVSDDLTVSQRKQLYKILGVD